MTFLRRETSGCFSSPRIGRPKSLTERDVRHIAKHITSNRDTRRQALDDITNVLNLSVCPKTLCKTITEDIGLAHRIQPKKHWLSPQQKAHRLKFALDDIHWTEEDWMKVEWTGEMSMQTDATMQIRGGNGYGDTLKKSILSTTVVRQLILGLRKSKYGHL